MSRIRPLTPPERKIYRNIYQVINGQSTINLDEGIINIQTPVPLENLEITCTLQQHQIKKSLQLNQ